MMCSAIKERLQLSEELWAQELSQFKENQQQRTLWIVALCHVLADIEKTWSPSTNETVQYNDDIRSRVNDTMLTRRGAVFPPKRLSKKVMKSVARFNLEHRPIYFDKLAYFKLMSAKNYQLQKEAKVEQQRRQQSVVASCQSCVVSSSMKVPATDYTMVSARDESHFTEQVRQRLDGGWELWGIPFAAESGILHQALVKVVVDPQIE